MSTEQLWYMKMYEGSRSFKWLVFRVIMALILPEIVRNMPIVLASFRISHLS